MATTPITEAEAQRRIQWLAEAHPSELLKQYRSSLGRMEAAVPMSDEYFDHSANVSLTERELLRRMGA